MAIAVFITMSIAILCLIKLDTPPVNVKHIDKLEHITAYFFLTLFWLLAFRKKSNAFIVLLLCFFYGIIIEVLQATLTTYRSGDYYDIIANVIGVFLAFTVFRVFFYKKDTF
ncbi:VanZ family protein [Tenacibaculum sp. MAR_2009_124]|uniref:VanZ family protein n=1 Tax=Tenacibaculum sp. MAR_2009_124 TaxID=1250059 RepID=UPI0021006BD1|nr:VanZ family protein [Tenacibaculum sp. MAR_2009_124]